MNPVVGLDVAKGESQVQAFLDQFKPYGKSFSMKHIKEELDHFLEFLKEIEEVTGQMPMVILESTGHYHSPVIQYLEDQGILYILLNPIISYQAKKSSLRKVKTDAIDAYQLCVLYYKEDLEPHKIRGIQLLDLRNLSRQQEIVTNMYVETKLQFHTILDQVFPEYRKVFGDLYSKVSLLMLKEYPTSEAVLTAGESRIAESVIEFCSSRSGEWAWGKAKKIMDSASRNPFQKSVYESHVINLRMYIELLFHYQGHLSDLEDRIVALANELEEYKIIQSIPGIGEKIAATIISEIGEIDRFNHPKKLVAFAGVDPSVHSSGKFTATINRITKRGSSRLRHSLYLAVLCGIRSSRNKKLKAFFDKKKSEGKPAKVAIVACMNKLLHWVYALLKRKEAFLDLS
ncbi:IS110 family transposase [Peribacillus frigoritolerans]|uniref:IS110 family transposase n=2 Tax=Peribacillus frigoritolerans TaxID=450367 RepID=UPI002280190C|nr:IS110 family transposase [Peribacillus frigoritolerans]MCY8939816.1 IS110 family transposase [Peribacillus frigoritolerans]